MLIDRISDMTVTLPVDVFTKDTEKVQPIEGGLVEENKILKALMNGLVQLNGDR